MSTPTNESPEEYEYSEKSNGDLLPARRSQSTKSTSSSLLGDRASIHSNSTFSAASVKTDRTTVAWRGLQNKARRASPLSNSHRRSALQDEELAGMIQENGSEVMYPSSIHPSNDSKPSLQAHFHSKPTRSNSGDTEEAYHLGRLRGMREKPEGVGGIKQKWDGRSTIEKHMMIWSVVVGVKAIIALIILLVLSQSKKMARSSLTGTVILLWICLAGGMAGGGRTLVEILIALNMVVVVGIFLTSQVDVLGM